MREVYYAVCLKKDYRIIILTCIAEAILNKSAKFHNNRLIVKKDSRINSFEKQILQKVRINTLSKIHASDLLKYFNHLREECVNLKLLYKFFNFYFIRLSGKKFPSKYRHSNKDIISFIETGNKNYLVSILQDVDKIILPSFKEKLSAIDSLKSVQEYFKIADGVDIII